MLQAIRDKAQGWIAWAIVILISIPFALWGIQEYLGVGGDPVVAEVDGVEITQREFEASVERYRSALREQLGAAYRPEVFPDEVVRQQVLEGMIRDLVVSGTARDLGLRAGDEMVRAEIVRVPAFQSAGRFDSTAYQAALRTQGYSPAAFEERLRDDLGTALLESGIRQGVLVTDREIDDFVRLRDQQRDVAFVTVTAAGFRSDTPPAEEEIRAVYDESPDRFMRPERVKIAYIELDLDQLAAQVDITDEALKTYYDDHKAAFTAPEKRRVRHILIPVESGDDAVALATAEEILASLRDGEEFAELAKSRSGDPGSAGKGGDLGLIGRGVMVEAFEEAAFGLEQGVVSDPVKTQFGYHLIEVTEIQPERVQSFDEAQDRLGAAYRKEQAERLFYDHAERLAELTYEQPDSLQPAAEALGLKVLESDWLTRDTAGSGVLASPKVVNAAFSEDVRERGNNSDLLELDATHYLVLRTLAHEAAARRPFDEVRGEIVESLQQRAAEKVASEQATKIHEAVAAGTALETAAADHGLTVEEKDGLTRRSGDIPPGLLRAVFEAPRPSAGEGVVAGQVALPDGDQAVFVVRQVTDADPAALNDAQRRAVQQQLAARRAQREYGSFVSQQRLDADVEIRLGKED